MRSGLSKKITNGYSKRGAPTNGKRPRSSSRAVWYDIPYPASAYTFPKDALIRAARFDKSHLHIEIADGRILSIPLKWIPSLCHAAPEERAKFKISRDRTMIIWDPDKCSINDELRLADYLGPHKPRTRNTSSSKKGAPKFVNLKS